MLDFEQCEDFAHVISFKFYWKIVLAYDLTANLSNNQKSANPLSIEVMQLCWFDYQNLEIIKNFFQGTSGNFNYFFLQNNNSGFCDIERNTNFYIAFYEIYFTRNMNWLEQMIFHSKIRKPLCFTAYQYCIGYFYIKHNNIHIYESL